MLLPPRSSKDLHRDELRPPTPHPECEYPDTVQEEEEENSGCRSVRNDGVHTGPWRTPSFTNPSLIIARRSKEKEPMGSRNDRTRNEEDNKRRETATIVLPPEIWNEIISWADPSTLAVLARVNTSAYSLAMPQLYSSISVPKTADTSKLLNTLCSPTSHDYSCFLRALDVPINCGSCEAVNMVLRWLPNLSVLKLKISGKIGWPFQGTRLNLTQFHWEVLQDKSAPPTIEHAGGPSGLSEWLESQPNIIKLKLVTHERIAVSESALRKLVRASGPMFIVSCLVPGRPVDTVQTTPRSRDATAGMSALGQSTGPLRHLKIVSRPELDHHRLLAILSESNPSLESISFEICGQVDNMREFLGKALKDLPKFAELQSLSFCSRVHGPLTTLDASYYRLMAEKVQRSCPKLRRIYFPGVMATLQPRRKMSDMLTEFSALLVSGVRDP
ncbi:hypothetical protein FS842_001181 [Serendipita sp. 407]|nr:hypothetical protein FS842_001181 [Serendipita sp. 407]